MEATASARSQGKAILAASSDAVPVRLWRYPASQVRSGVPKTARIFFYDVVMCSSRADGVSVWANIRDRDKCNGIAAVHARRWCVSRNRFPELALFWHALYNRENAMRSGGTPLVNIVSLAFPDLPVLRP